MKIIFCFIDEFEPQNILSIFLIFGHILITVILINKMCVILESPRYRGGTHRKIPPSGGFTPSWTNNGSQKIKTWDTFHVPQNLPGKNLQLFRESHFLVPHFLEASPPEHGCIASCWTHIWISRSRFPRRIRLDLDFPDVFKNKQMN